MIYTPRRPQWIHAERFDGNFGDPKLVELGLTRTPYGMTGTCQCGRPVCDHGMINGGLVCPGSYVMYEGKQVINIMTGVNFESIYRPLAGEDTIEVEAIVGDKDKDGDQGDGQ